MSFKSRLVQIRDLPAGAPISYARTFVTRRQSRIGVVAVGYGHGYSWLLSNRGAMAFAFAPTTCTMAASVVGSGGVSSVSG